MHPTTPVTGLKMQSPPEGNMPREARKLSDFALLRLGEIVLDYFNRDGKALEKFVREGGKRERVERDGMRQVGEGDTAARRVMREMNYTDLICYLANLLGNLPFLDEYGTGGQIGELLDYKEEIRPAINLIIKRGQKKSWGRRMGGREPRVTAIISELSQAWKRCDPEYFLWTCQRIEKKFARSTVYKALKELCE